MPEGTKYNVVIDLQTIGGLQGGGCFCRVVHGESLNWLAAANHHVARSLGVSARLIDDVRAVLSGVTEVGREHERSAPQALP